MLRPTPLAERLLKHSERRGECLIYLGSPNTLRPKMSLPGGKGERPYRVAYELEHGPIPPGYEIHHTCGVERCVEVAHLNLVTRLEHSLEHHQERDACANGHPWTPENTYIRGYSKAGRAMKQCRKCRSEKQSARGREQRRERREARDR